MHFCVIIKPVNTCTIEMQGLNTSVLFHFKVYVVNICVFKFTSDALL